MRTRLACLLLALALLLPVLGSSQTPTDAAPAFADPAFAQLWQQYDGPAVNGSVKSSYTWGPQPNSGPIMEDYAEGAGGKRLVQYFDKGRMEINNPAGDKSSPYYVTGGLLTRELITGQMQVGDNQFVTRWPAEIPIAGSDAPAYSEFRYAVMLKDPDLHNSGKVVDTMLWGSNPNPYYTIDPDLSASKDKFFNYGVKYAYYEQTTNHNIPDVFWNFLNYAVPGEPYFALTGYPLSDPYWIIYSSDDVGDILVQPFERRVMTYQPNAPNRYKVQFANVGQAYYDWRYKDAGKPEPFRSLVGRCGESEANLKTAGGLAKLWRENDSIQEVLGCPTYTVSTQWVGAVSRQFYEHGLVLQVIPNQEFTGYNAYTITLIMSSDGAVVKEMDTDTAKKLEAALTGEQTLNVNKDNVASTIQFFSAGFMVNPYPALKRIYVFDNNLGEDVYLWRGHNLPYIAANHWQVYDDTYTGP